MKTKKQIAIEFSEDTNYCFTTFNYSKNTMHRLLNTDPYPLPKRVDELVKKLDSKTYIKELAHSFGYTKGLIGEVSGEFHPKMAVFMPIVKRILNPELMICLYSERVLAILERHEKLHDGCIGFKS